MKALSALAKYPLGGLGIAAALVNGAVDNTNGLHTAVNVAMGAVGFIGPVGAGISLLWGVVDYFAGDIIFKDGKK